MAETDTKAPFASPGLSNGAAMRRGGPPVPAWLRQSFAQTMRGVPEVETLRFGREASGDAGSTAIRDAGDLARHFNPFQGEIDAKGRVLGGTGTTTINSEVQNYRGDFGAGNHVFEPDGLRLQATVDAGRFDSYLRGDITRRKGGFNSNPPGGTVPTRLSDIGLRPGDLDKVTVGDVTTNGPGGLATVAAIDRAAGTIVFEAVSGGARADYAGNFHLTFTRFAFAPLAAPAAIEEGVTQEVQLSRPLPPGIVPGCFARGVKRGPQPSNDPRSIAQACVASISADRRTVRFDRPLRFGAPMLAAEGDGLLFLPGLWSGQIWSKRSYGPQRQGLSVQAIRIEASFPALPNYRGDTAYTRADVEAVLNANSGMPWGFWPALWLYTWRPGPKGIGQRIVPQARNGWAEVDILELFTRLGQGPSVWSGNLHNQPYSRVRALAPQGGDAAQNGGAWRASAPDKKLLSANASTLLLPRPMADGERHSFGIVWTRGQVVHYMDDRPICVSDWPLQVDYPHQLGLNLACGSLAGFNPVALFFPQTQADAQKQSMTIHSVQSWEA
ncbi:hypothetical protein [Aureimonas sp. AU20]|uniref:hypothetical protein n=1 Tax=Aureimonas sp. AU20 TaxID=1349819 RepID=UPI00071EBC01|nr:hypothetical protein [Aureimonas sp. AU20]ALN71786.1 hypothetical protein M673_03615 [Aureimonas sp. AU20]